MYGPAKLPADVLKAYQDRISVAPMMSNELYITLLYRPFPSELAKRSVRASRTKESLTDYQNQTLATMEQQGALIERSLREFGPTLLGCYEQDGNLFWESGELFSFLINGVWRKVRFPTGPAYQALPDARLTFGGGMLEIRQGERRRYASMLSIKEFAGQVEPGTLGALLYEDSEFIETQSFSSLPRRQAMAALTTQRDQLLASDDAVVTQIEAMDVALDQLGDHGQHAVDMLGGARLDAGAQGAERRHLLVVVGREAVGDDLDLDAFLGGLGVYLVVDVGEVADIGHMIRAVDMAQQAVERVKDHNGAGVAEMGAVIDRGAADIEADIGGIEGPELLFLARFRIVQADGRHRLPLCRLVARSSNFATG